MAKKSIILYSSLTGNTEKVALRFKKVFDKQGWECDIFKVDKNMDFRNPPFNLAEYDFFCVGSYVVLDWPTEEIINLLVKNPLSGHSGEPTREELARRGESPKAPDGPPQGAPPAGGQEEQPRPRPRAKIIPGPQKGIVFATYGGMHLGPKEAIAALAQMDLEMEHMGIKCIGHFSCPGKHGNAGGDTWHKDLPLRPNERDLLRAELFLEEKLEECEE